MGANGSMDSDEVGDRVGDALKIMMELHFKIGKPIMMMNMVWR